MTHEILHNWCDFSTLMGGSNMNSGVVGASSPLPIGAQSLEEQKGQTQGGRCTKETQVEEDNWLPLLFKLSTIVTYVLSTPLTKGP
jgi:hypothetical protein